MIFVLKEIEHPSIACLCLICGRLNFQLWTIFEKPHSQFVWCLVYDYVATVTNGNYVKTYNYNHDCPVNHTN